MQMFARPMTPPAVVGRVRAVVTLAVDRARPWVTTVTPLGWTMLGIAVLAWFFGWQLQWAEMMIIAAGCLVVVLLSGIYLVGRASLRIDVELEPRRVVVGSPAAGRIVVTNLSRRRLLPLRIEVPVGVAAASFAVPSLGSRDLHEEIFVVPTQQRAVIPVGPASSVRGDPLGLLRREVAWTDPIELIVHPRIVNLDSFGAGLLRDLEGRSTDDISMSDLAFHALREYVPGDDVRYVHWRTSARVGKLIVRQFVDTRRSLFTVVVDGSPDSYGADEFEDAVSAAASVAVRAIRDGQETTAVAAGVQASSSSAQRILDALARTEMSPTGADLSSLAARASRLAPATSLALLITGSKLPFATMRTAASWFSPEVKVLALRVDPASPSGVTSARSAEGFDVVSLGKLEDLPALLRAARS